MAIRAPDVGMAIRAPDGANKYMLHLKIIFCVFFLLNKVGTVDPRFIPRQVLSGALLFW